MAIIKTEGVSDLITINAALDMLAAAGHPMPRHTLYRKIHRLNIPVLKVGTTMLLQPESLEWIVKDAHGLYDAPAAPKRRRRSDKAGL